MVEETIVYRACCGGFSGGAVNVWFAWTEDDGGKVNSEEGSKRRKDWIAMSLPVTTTTAGGPLS